MVADGSNLRKGYRSLCRDRRMGIDSCRAHIGTDKDSNNSNLWDKDRNRDTSRGNRTDKASGTGTDMDRDMGFYNLYLSRRRCIAIPGLEET